jgi:plastocyanin/methionine-rich copper-binding protein CopC
MITSKLYLKVFILILILIVSIAFLTGCRSGDMEVEEDTVESDMDNIISEVDDEASAGEPGQDVEFLTPVKTPHYVDNVPAHASSIPAVPVNVVINFDFDVIPLSEIVIIGPDGQIYSVGDTIIDDNKLGMRVMMQPDSPDGLYTVEYSACWPDGSCHEGMFQFVIERALSVGFIDLRGQSEVLIDMNHNNFDPQDIIIDAGTTLTWINNDTVDHYINTDPHPGHNYYPEFNSRAIANGETFSVLLAEPGYYPYHCSAHPATMTATIIVE